MGLIPIWSKRITKGHNKTESLNPPEPVATYCRLDLDDLRSLIPRLGQHGVTLAATLGTGEVVEIRAMGHHVSRAGIRLLQIDAQANDVLSRIASLPPEQGCVHLHHALHHLSDYRRVISVCCGRLAVGGWLVISVAHQFLSERRLQLPSRRDARTLRFYTPASLMIEIEEALEPTEYRVRLLCDVDEEYDTSVPLEQVPNGSQSLVVALQRVARPEWADRLGDDTVPLSKPTEPSRFVHVDPNTAAPYNIITPMAVTIRRILVVKLDHRGDFLLAERPLQELRGVFPVAHITFVCGTWNVDVARASGLFQDVVAFDYFHEDNSSGSPIMPEGERLSRFQQLFDGIEFDLAIDLRLFEDTRRLLEPIKAVFKAGFDRRSEFQWIGIGCSLPSPTRDGRAEQGAVLARDLHCREGRHRIFALDFEGGPAREGDPCLVWGPYVQFEPGTYLFELQADANANANDPFELGYDVSFNDGEQRLVAGVLQVGTERAPTFAMRIQTRVERMEIRLFRLGDFIPKMRIYGFSYRREGEIFGLHQTEAMCLLVKLVAMRLEYAYKVERLT